MANTTIQLKKSSTPSAVPSSLEFGELAINYADGKLYYKNTNSQIAEISGSGGGGGNSFGTVNANGVLIISDTSGDVLTLEAGDNITIVGDAINDKIIISATGGGTADVGPAFNQANAAFSQSNAAFNQANLAFDAANSILVISNTAPTNTKFWFHSELGKLFINYADSNSTQWVDTTRGQFSPISIDVTSDIRTINTSNNVLITDSFILANGTLTLTLPTASSVSGRQYKIKNIGTGDVTLLPQSGEKIDADSSTIIGEQYSALTLLSTGSGWLKF